MVRTTATYNIRYEVDVDSLPDASHRFESIRHSVLNEPLANLLYAYAVPDDARARTVRHPGSEFQRSVSHANVAMEPSAAQHQ